MPVTSVSKMMFAVGMTVMLLVCACGKKKSPTSPVEEKLPPTALFTASLTTGSAPLKVTFNASSSSDQDGNIISYVWTFSDDASTATGITTVHTFQSEGHFSVTLTVTDNDSLKSHKTISIIVTAPPGPKYFPMYLGAQWTYTVAAALKLITENYTREENGKITVTLTSFNAQTMQAKLSVKGDLVYFNNTIAPYVIPSEIYIKESSNGLDRSDSRSGPWKRAFQTFGTWTNGELIFAGSTSRTMSAGASAVTVPAGVFSGTLVGVSESNWGQAYRTDDHEYVWKELLNVSIGIVWSKHYTYFDDKGDMYGPAIKRQELSLTGYAIPLPDGTISRGGTGASVQLVTDSTPGVPFGESDIPTAPVIDAPIHLYFSEDMDQASVSEAFGVGASQRGNLPPPQFAHAGTITWDGNRHMIWTPLQPYISEPAFQDIYVYARLKTSARSIAGNSPGETALFIFCVKAG